MNIHDAVTEALNLSQEETHSAIQHQFVLIKQRDDFRAERDALASKLSAIEAQEPVAWGAFYCGGENRGRLYNHCYTEESIRKYIADVHQANCSITLRAGKLYAAPVAPAQPLTKEKVEDVIDILENNACGLDDHDYKEIKRAIEIMKGVRG